MIKENKELFTAKGLVVYANERFKQKKTGTKFDCQDIENYIRRGYFPKYLGGYLIKEHPKTKYSGRQYEVLEEQMVNKTKYKYHKNKYE